MRGSIAVIIPTYDHGPLIRETIESVLAQTRPAAEIVIVNDGAPIDPADFIGDLMARGPIRVIRQENAGTAAARNFGASQTVSDYVVFLDDDDLHKPRALEYLGALLDDDPKLVGAVGATVIIDHERPDDRLRAPEETPDGRYFELLLDRNRFWASAVLMRRDGFERAGQYRTHIRGVEDFDLWLRLAHLGPIGRTAEHVLDYHFHAGSFSKKLTQLDYVPDVARMASKLAGRDAGVRVRLNLMLVWVDEVFWAARADLREHRYFAAIHKMWRSFRSVWSPSPSWRCFRYWLSELRKNIAKK